MAPLHLTLVALLIVPGPWSAIAGQGDPASDPAPVLDLQLEALKNEALALGRELGTAERTRLHPSGQRARFHVSVSVPLFMLDRVSLRIDDQLAASYRYSESEARAVLRDGWHRLTALNLEPGVHRLQVEYLGHFSGSSPEAQPVSGQLETTIEKGESDMDWVLPISRKTRHDRPELWQVVRAGTGADDDSAYRTALFLKYDDRYFSALVGLLGAVEDPREAAALPLDHQMLLGASYLGFGMHQAAEAVYRKLAGSKANPQVLAAAELELARLAYQRGYVDRSARILEAIQGRLPSALQGDGRALLAAVLLAQGRNREVTDLIAGGASPDSSTSLGPDLRYNLAVALGQSGRENESRFQLAKIGILETKDEDTRALRDKANLILGYQYLQEQNGNDAKACFSRVHAQGLFSTSALLGLGWAELALAPAVPGKEPARESAISTARDSLGALLDPGRASDSDRNAIKVDANTAGSIPPEEQAAIQRALIPWAELVRRDPMDSAVQEGMLAVAWALETLRSDAQSIKYYQTAVESQENALKRMAKAREAIRSGRMVRTMIHGDPESERGWKWRLINLADEPETYFTQRLLAQNHFQEALKNHRDGLLLVRTLEAWNLKLTELQRLTADAPAISTGTGGLPTAVAENDAVMIRDLREKLRQLQARIADNSAAQARHLETLALTELDGQTQQIERYLTESRSAVARVFERQLGAAP